MKNNTFTGQGNFFAVDRRAWTVASKLDINAMSSYIVLARGTGADQRTTAWSVNAIESYTGISRPRGKAAIEALAQAALIHVIQKGTKPRYKIAPAHEVPGSEVYRPPILDGNER